MTLSAAPTQVAPTPGPNDTLPHGTASRRAHHAAHGETCHQCWPYGLPDIRPALARLRAAS